MTHVPVEAEGIYLFVKSFWSPADVGHLWYAAPGHLRVFTLTGAPHLCFDWNPDLVDEGYIVRLKVSHDFIYHLRRQSHPYKLGPQHKAEWERIQGEKLPAPPSWKPPAVVKMTKKLRKLLHETADPKNRNDAVTLTGREVAMILQAIS